MGYGDQLGRFFLTYAIEVSAFADLMFVVAGRPLSFDSIRDVFVLSITSFHGRGVQPPGLPLNDALATLSAIEAYFGLTIEGLFIAAFTRRATGGLMQTVQGRCERPDENHSTRSQEHLAPLVKPMDCHDRLLRLLGHAG